MRRLIFSVGLFLCAANVLSQEKSGFGAVNISDFQTDFGKDYAAAVLYDKGRSTFAHRNGSMIIQYERESRTIIREKAGFNYAEIRIPFYSDGFGKTEEIVNIIAITHNVDSMSGELSMERLDPSQVYEEDINQFWKVKKFVFPDVHEGSILELKYVKRTPFLFNPPDWEFQRSIPVKKSTYEIWLVPFYEYTYLLQGASGFDSHNSYKSRQSDSFAGVTYNFMVHSYTMTNIPAFEDESFITSRDDYLVKLDFQLSRINYPTGGSREIMTSWPDINNDFLKSDNFGKYLRRAEKEADDYLEGTGLIEQDNRISQLRQIIEKVRSDFNWSGDTDKYTTERVKDVLSSRKGNSAELNLFMCAVLREAGFNANPVLISTRGHGKIHPKYPFSHYFNDVVCFVEFDGNSVLVDATEKLLPYNRLPLRCLNETGLIVEENGERWVSLETTAEAFNHQFVEIEPDPAKEESHITAAHRLSGYSGYIARKSVDNNVDRLAKSSLVGDIVSLKDVDFKHVNEPEQPYQVRYAGSIPLEVYADKLLIEPFADLVEKETPLKSKNRRYPVDMIYRKKRQLISKIHIPDGYRVLERPMPVNIDDNLMTVKLNFVEQDEALQVTGTIHFKKAVYQAGDYQKLRDHYLRIVTAFNEPVILQKVSGEGKGAMEK